MLPTFIGTDIIITEEESVKLTVGKKGDFMKNFIIQLGKALCYLLLFVGMQFLVSFGAVFTMAMIAVFFIAAQMQPVDEQMMTEQLLEQYLGQVPLILILSNGLTILVLWLFFKIRKKKLIEETGMASFPLMLLPILAVLGLLLNVFVSFGLSLLPDPILADYTEQTSGVFETVTFLSVLAQVVAAPLAEELIFRGGIFSRLKRAMPVWAAAVASSIMFGLVHGQLLWAAYAFLLGILFCAVVVKTGSLLTAVVLHMAFNLGGVLLPLLPMELTVEYVVGIAAEAGAVSALILYWIFRRKSFCRAAVQDNVHSCPESQGLLNGEKP